MLKACKHREPVNFRLGFSETPLLPGVKRKPVRSQTKRNPSSRAIRRRCLPVATCGMAVMPLVGTAARPILILFAARLSRTASRTLRTAYSLDSMSSKSLLATHRLPVSSNCLCQLFLFTFFDFFELPGEDRFRGCNALARFPHETGKTERQFADPFGLPPFNRLRRNQFATHPDRRGACQNVISGCLLIHAPGGD